jgi:hypothetical protein
MATLHLPKNRPAGSKDGQSKRKVDRDLDKALEDTFPASDPVALTTPGSSVQPDEDTKRKKSGQNPG